MNVAFLPSASVILSTILALFAVASPVHADGSSPSYAEKTLDALLAASAPETSECLGLPTRMTLWSAAEEEFEIGDAHPLSLSEFLPQGRQSQHGPPFVDFSHFEMGAFAGVADFSSDFKASATWVVGLSARVPVPGIPGNWGIFAEGFVSYINRNLPFYYKNKAGTWIGAEVGGDYTFIRDEIWYLRAQAGILYAWWDNVNALDNGFGALGGIQVGFYWIKHNQNAVVTITPQFSYDGKNWIGIFTIGFSYDF
jgi:hypothetical protein